MQIMTATLLMMLACAAPVRAQLISTHPPPSPEEAVRILRASHSIADRTDRVSVDTGDGPRVYVMKSSPTAGPYGEFAPFPPRQQTDGGAWLDPVAWDARGYLGYGLIMPAIRANREPHRSAPVIAPVHQPAHIFSPQASGGNIQRP